MRNMKKIFACMIAVTLLIGSMSMTVFAADPDVLTVNIKNASGVVIATEGYTRAELEAMALQAANGDDLKVKYSSLDKLPAWRTTIATGIDLEDLIQNTDSSITSFAANDSFTFADVNSSKPASFTATYGNLYDSARSYFNNLPDCWEETVLDASGNVVTPGYLIDGDTSALDGETVTPMLALTYSQARYLTDYDANYVTLSSSGTPMLCYGLKATELLSPLAYTNNNFLREIDIVTFQLAN